MYEGFVISYVSDSNDLGNDTEAESLISTPEVEIENDDKSIPSISKEERLGFFQREQDSFSTLIS